MDLATVAIIAGLIVAILTILGYVCGAFRAVAEWRRRRRTPEEEMAPSPPVTAPAKPLPAAAVSPDAILPIFSVPYARNPNFTGRESLLKAVREALEGGEAAALTQAIVGLGGVGKTQLALEYAYRHREDYQVVWWVRSEGPELAADYGGLAVKLGLIGADVPDQREIVAAARGWLEQNSGWLLILDNVPDAKAVYDYLPRGGDGHVLITSRSQALGEVATTVDVPEFPRPESIAFLKKRTGKTEGADAVAEEVGDLPLALEQAAAYVEATRCTLGEYTKLFQTSRETLWKGQKPPLGYNETVGTTWAVAMDRVKRECAPAADLLNLCAFLAPDDIPLDVIGEHAEHLPEGLAEAVGDKAVLNKMKAALRRYSFVKVEGDSLSIHRLVQAVTRDRLSEEERKERAGAAVRLLDAAFPFKEEDPATWEESARRLPHALAAAGHAEKLCAELATVGSLYNNAGGYLYIRADFGVAKATFERALAIGERLQGPDHPDVGRSVVNLGGMLLEMGQPEEARPHFERALAIDEKAYGPDHPEVAIDVSCLGLVLQDLGDPKGAKAHLERALAIDEKVYGSDHPKVAIRLNNVGSVLQDLGDLPGAKERFERALAIDEKVYGPDHPEVATDVNNLGGVLRATGDLDGAKEHYQRALGIGEKAFGPDHPKVGMYAGNLGKALTGLGELEAARQCCERALAIMTRTYPDGHPYVAVALSALADVLQDSGDLQGTKEHYERALAILRKFLGEEHPNTQIVRRKLEVLGEAEGA
jgi:tetratricopeptide (TPR) repeat protein